MRLFCAILICILGTGFQAAHACGGFFCNNNQPITQAAERILFALDNGRIHMHVRIQYDGPPDEFGWLLPVPPDDDLEVGLSTEALFTQLDTLYAPQFNIRRVFDENCPPPPEAAFDSAVEDGGVARSAGVNVISREAVGPYDRATLKPTSVEALRGWLDTEGFFIPPVIDQKLGPYVERGQYFVAIRLLASAGTDDIAPLYLNFAGSKPSIPIVPTSVAANPDMGVLVHMLYNQRAVPLNYLHVQINEAALDLSNGGQNYPDVVSQAMDEAGGKAFTTDFAGELDGRLQNAIQPITQAQVDEMTSLQAVVQGPFGSDADVQRVVTTEVIFPEGTSASEFWANPFGYQDLLELTLNTETLWAKFEMEVNPARRTLLDRMEAHPYLTRLYSTLSPEEMTLDPEFTFNPDMSESVDNIRTIEVRITCDENGAQVDGGTTLVNSAGETVEADLSGRSSTRREDGVTVQGQEVPAAAIIEITGDRGDPQIVGSMGMVDPTVIPMGDNETRTPGGTASTEDGMDAPMENAVARSADEESGCDGCSQTNNPFSSLIALGLVLAMNLRRWRR